MSWACRANKGRYQTAVNPPGLEIPPLLHNRNFTKLLWKAASFCARNTHRKKTTYMFQSESRSSFLRLASLQIELFIWQQDDNSAVVIGSLPGQKLCENGQLDSHKREHVWAVFHTERGSERTASLLLKPRNRSCMRATKAATSLRMKATRTVRRNVELWDDPNGDVCDE